MASASHPHRLDLGRDRLRFLPFSRESSMAKFNTGTARPSVHSPIVTERAPSARTHEGGPGYTRDARSELFLLAVTNMVAEKSFYETAEARDDRFEQLVRQVALDDPDWMARFIPWLRAEANMRSASVVAACETVNARLDAVRRDEDMFAHDSFNEAGYNRKLINAVCQRADEPGEVLAYWTSRYGRAIPKPVKRGVADAVARLYSGKSLLKYDSDAKGYRFGDVIDLVHPSPADDKPWQGDLFRYALDRRHNREDARLPEGNFTLAARQHLVELPVERRREYLTSMPNIGEKLAEAGMTWEALAGWLQGPMDAEAWSAVIPSMGIMALARNLRNFDQAGVSDAVATTVAARFADAEQVATSRMFPFRWLSAYRAAPSLRWAWPLEQALGHSLASIPVLSGRTLVLVDRSPSMWQQQMSGRSTMPWSDAAAVFGAAVALRAEDADLVEFGIDNRRVPFARGESVLKVMERFTRQNGTNIPNAVRDHFKGHGRVVIVTDEQSQPGYLPWNSMDWRSGQVAIDDLIPRDVPLYLWNFGGYKHGTAPSGSRNRHTFGGLTDAAFRMIPLLESGRDGNWPF
jgi:hypothetical protein